MEPNPEKSPIPAPAKRKRGGQPGNLNAIRHGLYSKSFTESEMLALDSNVNGEFKDEIDAALAYYQRHKKYVDARITLEEA